VEIREEVIINTSHFFAWQIDAFVALPMPRYASDRFFPETTLVSPYLQNLLSPSFSMGYTLGDFVRAITVAARISLKNSLR
jgi:hypothetical protein